MNTDTLHTAGRDNDPILPNYRSGSIRSTVIDLLAPTGAPRPVVVLVLDGLGWEQLEARWSIAPSLAGMTRGTSVSVVPSTTATALTSITTGLTPGEHGIVGYRAMLGGDVVNMLRWSSVRGDMRTVHLPADVQPFAPFTGADVVVSTRAEFDGTGFTEAHLRGARAIGWSQPSNLPVLVAAAVRGGAGVVYAYYDGIDHAAHEFGFGDLYDAELSMADMLVGQILDRLPSGTTLIVTADHGQVHVGDQVIPIDRHVAAMTAALSGEGRFRWIHARPGAAAELADAARQAYAEHAWVVTRHEAIAAGWFGPVVSPPVAARYGDVAVVARSAVTFDDPAERTRIELICRHGSLTSAEMIVPRLVATV